MESGSPEAQKQVAPLARSDPEPGIGAPAATTETGNQPIRPAKKRMPASSRLPSIIVGVVVAVVAALSIWYLVRPQPLLVQGEVDATRFDIAARVDGRVAEVPVIRGQDVAAGAVLVRIDNPETIAKNEQAMAAKVVAEAQLANINVGTRVETIAARKAALERAQASVVLAQKTYDRVSQLAEHGNAPIARLDQATDALHESQRAVDQAKSAYEHNFHSFSAVLGNDLAIQTYREGKLPFPDGAIIAALHYRHVPSEENNKVFGQAQSFVPGTPTNIQFMVKDTKKYAATGGWVSLTSRTANLATRHS